MWPCDIDAVKGALSAVTRVGPQMIAAAKRVGLALDYDGIENCIELRDVMLIGTGND